MATAGSRSHGLLPAFHHQLPFTLLPPPPHLHAAIDGVPCCSIGSAAVGELLHSRTRIAGRGDDLNRQRQQMRPARRTVRQRQEQGRPMQQEQEQQQQRQRAGWPRPSCVVACATAWWLASRPHPPSAPPPQPSAACRNHTQNRPHRVVRQCHCLVVAGIHAGQVLEGGVVGAGLVARRLVVRPVPRVVGNQRALQGARERNRQAADHAVATGRRTPNSQS